MKEKRWIIRKDYDLETVEKLAASLGVDRIIATLLVERGVTTFEEARKFFRPGLDQIHDPFLMKGMREAVDRINEAIRKQERIMVYGDYDVDGTSAVALLYSYLKELDRNIDFYVPDREREGYGISYQGIDYAHETGVKLMIALDCGIKAMEQVDYAKERGIDFIIGDHHLPGDEVPRAVAVLDPKQSDCPYPYKELSGCGISFKIVEAHLEERMGVRLCDLPEQLDAHRLQRQEELKLKLLKYLDLVAVSIASDIVPIMGENRILAYHGMKQLNNSPSTGLKAIIDVCGLTDKDIHMSDIIFKIGPRINASGRIQNGKESVRLLIEHDYDEAQKKAQQIDQYNEERKELDKRMTEEASQLVSTLPEMKDESAIVIVGDDWHKGVIGIVASRLTEQYFRPAVVLTKSAGEVTGSARSVTGFDVYKAIESCRDLLENFGGHTYAAGLSMREENVDAFRERFNQYVAANIRPEQIKPQLHIDAEISFKEITSKLHNDLKRMRPFGPENTKPVFCTHQVYDYGTSKVVGRDQEHIKLELVDNKSNNVMNGIAFGQSSEARYIKTKRSFDIVYTIEENTHKHGEVQLLIEDIKTHADDDATSGLPTDTKD